MSLLDSNHFELPRYEIKTNWLAWRGELFLVPPKVANLRIVSIGADNILLAWDSPREPHIDAYDVTFYAVGSNENASTVYTKYSNITFQNLMQQTKYSFQVRPFILTLIRLITFSHFWANFTSWKTDFTYINRWP